MSSRVLLIGRSSYLLRRLSAALEKEGFISTWTNKGVGAAARLRPEDYDLVAFGRGIYRFDKERIKEMFSTGRPGMRYVYGLAPIIALLVDQVRLALAEPPASRFRLEPFFKGEQGLQMRFSLQDPADLQVDLYRLGPLFRVRRETLSLGQVCPGNHTVALAAVFGRRQPDYVSVKSGNAVLEVQPVLVND